MFGTPAFKQYLIMTTWCIMNGLIRRLKYSSALTHKSSVWFGVQSSQECKEPFRIELCCSQTRLIHTSFGCYGKKGPKGVPRRRNPLKTDKKTKLERVSIYKDMTVLELAKAMNKSTDHVYEVLMFLPSTNEYDHDDAVMDRKTITDIVRKSNMVPEIVGRKEKKMEKESTDVIRQSPPDPDVLVRRSPVVTIMGHVDHGKTTLLDQLRNSNIVDGEFGGITQHIGAFRVTLQTGESICFLDTPGHAAFSAMRSRGAQLTDIVVLVVAADDGVMQQTLESIQHARESEVPVIIAINKIDKANADVERTKYMLLEHQIQLEEFGGDVQAVPISALQGTNLLELQEAIVTQAELMNLRGDPLGLVEGRVVEARVDTQRGRLVTAVIQRGTLRRGDFLLAGTAWAKVRAMFDDSGRPVQEVPPATPVEILGWKEEIPSAGDEILQVKTEAELKSALAWRLSHEMKKKQEQDLVVIEEKRELHHQDYHAKMVARRQLGFYKDKRGKPSKEINDTEDVPRFSLVLKGDVDGSVEAILDSLDTYRSKKCRLDIIHFGVGNVTESDVEMAAAFGGEVYAFNVDMIQKVSELAKTKGVPVRKHNIIYRLFENLKQGINRKLPKIREDTVIGEAKVLQVFRITLPSKKKTFVAGCRCTQGNVSKKLGIKVLRNDEIIYEGYISSLKHFKDEVELIKKEQECGISLDNSEIEFQPQDVIVNYEMKDIDQEIDWDPGF